MNKTWLIAFCLLSAGASSAQSTPRGKLRFDLSRIGFVVEGNQVCEDKGRLQDFPSKVMDQIIAAGPKSVPVLIGMITDARPAKTTEPIICYWPGMAIGDIAFCTLANLFTDASYSKTTMPGAGWNDLLGPGDNGPAWEQLDSYIRKHGRKSLQVKWRRLWNKYGGRMFWDPKGRCFKLKAQ